MDEDQVTEPEEEGAGGLTKYRLTDVTIDTVGLVPKGANRQSFFLLKNEKEATMPDDITIEEVVPEDAPEEVRGILKQVGDGIARLFQKAEAAEPEEPPEDDPQPEPAATPAPAQPPPAALANDGNLEKILKAQTDRFEALLKAQKAEFDQQVGELKAELTKANERAEKAEQYADGQTEAAEKQAAVQKALAYRAIPVKPADMGDLLYTLEKKLDEKEFETVEAVLKAMDKQAWAAGLFSEFGTSRTAEEVTLEAKVEKIQKEQGLSYAEALLSLPAHEQIELLGEEVK